MANTIELSSQHAVDSHEVIDLTVKETGIPDRVVKTETDEKVFRAEESVLTLMKKNETYKSFYNFIVGMLILLMVESALYDYYRYQRIYFMTRTLKRTFNKLHLALMVWGIMQLTVIALYYAFELWTSVRKALCKKRVTVAFWDYASLTIYVVFQLVFLISGQYAVYMVDFSGGTGTALSMENFRFLMKMHAFVRRNAAIVLTTEEANFSLRKYLYFLFAPTLFYRDSYPRTPRIRWGFLFVSFLEFVGALFFECYYYERHLRPTYYDLGKTKVSVMYLLKSICFTGLSCWILHIPNFYLFMHAWLNFFAELLRFADRRFYEEWWEVDNFYYFFRRSNLVIQEWLHEFIYKDLKKYCPKFVRRFIILFGSAFFHELILCIVLRFFYPVLFIGFFFVSSLFISLASYVPKLIKGTMFWIAFNLGMGLWITLYLIEQRARTYCTVEDDWTSFFIPVSWNCIFK